MKRNFSHKKGISTAIIAAVVVVIIVIGAVAAYALTIKPSSTTATVTSTAPGGTTTVMPTTTSSSSPVTTTTTSSASSQTPVTLTVWDTYAPGSGEFAAFNKTISTFSTVYPWITLNVQTQAFGSAEADFITASLANQGPDILRVSNDWTGSLVAQGFIQPIDSFMNSTLRAEYSNASLADYTYNGHLYGLGENVNGLALVYNKALVPTPPTTTAQLVTDAESIAKLNSTGGVSTAGIVFPANNGYWWYPFLYGFGGAIFQPGTVPPTPEVNSSAAVAATTFLNQLVYPDQVMPPQASSNDMLNLFVTGHAGMIIDGPWDISSFESNSSLDWGVAPLPTVSNTSMPIAPFLGSQGWEISSGLPANVQQAAFDFITFVTSEQAQMNLFTLAGDLPTSTALASSTTITGNSTVAGFVAQEATASAFPNSPAMGDTWTPVGNALVAAEPTTQKGTVSMSTIQAQLDMAETAIITAEGSG